MEALVETQAYDIRSFCKAYSVSRSFAYLEMKRGRLRPFKAGRRTLISRAAAQAWQRSLEDASQDTLAPATSRAGGESGAS